jgi:hypothetical protein
VNPCPTLGSDAAVGVFEDITPPGVQLTNLNGQTIFGTQAILVNPKDTTNIYVGVQDQGIYKSMDCGATWAKINTGMNGNILDTGATWSMVIDPVDPNIIYSVNGYGSEMGLWKSTDGGVDWTQLMPADSEIAQVVSNTFTSIVAMDPTDHLHLVVSFHSGCTGAYAPTCQAETKDGGMNWRLFKGPPPTNFEGAGPMVINETTWLYGMVFDGLWLTTDSGATWKNVTPMGTGGSGWEMYHSPLGPYYIGGSSVLSSPDGLTWTAIPNGGGSITAVTGSGKNLYASQQYSAGFFTASESDPSKWTQMATPGKPDMGWGAYLLAYDTDHGLLYASAQGGGLWRVVTP